MKLQTNRLEIHMTAMLEQVGELMIQTEPVQYHFLLSTGRRRTAEGYKHAF